MEIERKFLINEFPINEKLIESSIVSQSYLSLEPEVRIRSKDINGNTEYTLTVKGNGSLSRQEVNISIEAEIYYELLNMIQTKPIMKDCNNYLLETGHILECSRVDPGTETSFMYAEIEFETEKEALGYEPPEFIIKEITYDPKYKMKNYWKNK